MLKMLKNIYHSWFADPQAAVLLLTIVGVAIIITVMGETVVPLLASIVIAYLLNGIMLRLERQGCSHILAVSLVSLLFVGIVLFALFWLLPLLWRETSNLLVELPQMVGRGQNFIIGLPQRYPNLISGSIVDHAVAVVKAGVGSLGKLFLSFSLSSITNLIQLSVYLVLVPLLVFFILKDKELLIKWASRFLPRDRRLVGEVWTEINTQFGNYIRGKVIEVVIVSFISALVFVLMDLKFAVLLGVLVGLSAFIPFVGVFLVTIPVLIVAFLQWGWGAHFGYLMVAYAVIIILDGNILVPLLFSGVMDIHPIAIIAAVLFFGNLWGFWGIFFAIPLATVVKAVLTVWPNGTFPAQSPHPN